MRKLLLSLTVLLVLASQGQAQDSVKKEKIRALFALMHQDSLMAKMLDGMTSSFVKSMSTMFNDSVYKKHGVDVVKLREKLIVKSMQRSKVHALRLVNEDMVDVYDKHFTLEEIQDFTTFYQSPSGQKLLSQTPGIAKDLMDIMATKYQKESQQSMMQDIKEVTNEMSEQTKGKHK
jgi:uncharacterized protein